MLDAAHSDPEFLVACRSILPELGQHHAIGLKATNVEVDANVLIVRFGTRVPNTPLDYVLYSMWTQLPPREQAAKDRLWMVNRPATMPAKPAGYGPLLVSDLYDDDGKGNCRNLTKGHSIEMLLDVKDSLPPPVAARLIELRR
ncbi:hypothetical protein [Rhizobium sp. P44RR-XXIV]|uniref:hypothetical protein n=1 Tax=Rhizobium sp. P44RR-XXIV TaxID=1921145 RepID=UPI00098649D6|nr:hypothetical protein [Rhizobium sp. P44RR-XXIV]TIX90517.1 hypothetical protein BSK43_014700 [Rhizobium sp. P44RR-XXIV]